MMPSPMMATVADLVNQIVHVGQTLLDWGLAQSRWILVERGPTFVANVLAAGAIFWIGKRAAHLAERMLEKILRRAKVDETLSRFLCRISYMLLLCSVGLSALNKLGVDTMSLAAVLAAAGLAIGMALQGSLSNFAAGVMIILFRPFKVGDFIEAAGTKGIVEEIHVFSTMLRTGDNVAIVVPNNSVTSGNITNYSSKPTRRIDLEVGCGYNDDIRAVKEFLEHLLATDERILLDPKPVIAVSSLGDNSVNFVVRPWVHNSDYWAVRWELVERIKLGFDEHGFTIPFPQRDVHVIGMHDSKKSFTQPSTTVSRDDLSAPGASRNAPQLPRRVA